VFATLLVAAAFLGWSVAGASAAQDPGASLVEAERRAAAIETERSGRQRALESAEARHRAAASAAAPLVRVLEDQRAEVDRLRAQLIEAEEEAGNRIVQLQERYRQEVDDHDEEVRTGVDFGLAALVAGFIALAWGWFRATAAVAALTEIQRSQAIGVCVGGGLLLLVIGGALGSSDGAVGAIGSFLFCLGLILPTALLLARHSAEVQRGRSRPLLRRERLPAWVPLTAAGLMLLLFAASTGSAIFADGVASQPVPPELREQAKATSEGSGAEELKTAEEEAAKAEQRAAGPLARKNATEEALAAARRSLQGVKRRLANARADQRSAARRLVALEEREQREAERAEARAIREEEALIEQEEEELASECHPSYSGCLNPYSPDYDCEGGSGDGPDYTGTVTVTGYDEYGLDANNNGVGCEE
jgi:hypothetical protein